MSDDANLSEAEHVVLVHGDDATVQRWFVRLRAAPPRRRPDTDHTATQRLPRFA